MLEVPRDKVSGLKIENAWPGDDTSRIKKNAGSGAFCQKVRPQTKKGQVQKQAVPDELGSGSLDQHEKWCICLW
jgi:hypothetical protein